MNVKTESEINGDCTFCYNVFWDNSDLATLDEDIVLLLQILNENIDTFAFRNLSICKRCLENINAACKFKTSIKNLTCQTASVEIKEEFCDKMFVTCFICKNSVKEALAVPILDHSFMEDIITILPKQDLEIIDSPQVCESCQISMLNLHNTLELLANVCGAVDNYSMNECKKEYRVILKDEPLIADTTDMFDEIKEETNNLLEKTIKIEVKEEQSEVDDQEFQIRPEELDLKMDAEERDSSEGVWEHEKIVEPHLNKAEHNKKQDNQKATCNVDCKGKTFNCLKCQYQTNCKTYFTSHMVLHEDIDESEIFKCHHCIYLTKSKSSLKRHMLVHKSVHETKMFKCNQCEFQSKRKISLKNHMLLHKDVDETDMFKCEQCKFQTKRKICLRNHMLVHKDINETKMFRCQQCKFQSKHRHSLIRHMTTHSDVNKPEMFKCQRCDFQSKRKISLKNHILLHKYVDESEMFKCDPSEFQSTQKISFQDYMLLHKKFMKL